MYESKDNNETLTEAHEGCVDCGKALVTKYRCKECYDKVEYQKKVFIETKGVTKVPMGNEVQRYDSYQAASGLKIVPTGRVYKKRNMQ